MNILNVFADIVRNNFAFIMGARCKHANSFATSVDQSFNIKQAIVASIFEFSGALREHITDATQKNY